MARLPEVQVRFNGWSILVGLAVLAGCKAGVVGDVDPAFCENRAGESACDGQTAVTCDEKGKVESTEECDPASATCIQGACVTCSVQLTVPMATSTKSGIFLEVALGEGGFSEIGFRTRPVHVTAEGGGTLSQEGGTLEVYDAAGTSIPLPFSLEPSTDARTFYVRGLSAGTNTLTVSPPTGCETGSASVVVRTGASPGLVGRTLDGYPHFEYGDAVNVIDSVQTAIDPTRYFDRVGLAYDAYIVEHRTAAEWEADNSLVDVADGMMTATVMAGSITDNVLDLWLSDLPVSTELWDGYDVVYDFGQDGTLDPGDLIDGIEGPGFAVVIDLTTPGPNPTEQFEYSTSFWQTQMIYAPTNINELGRLPLVVISHGNGHDYTWYDYLGHHLASWGYVVMSHRNETEPGVLTAAATTYTNTDTFLGDLAILGDGRLDGHIQNDQIVWIGHSRGGEGVAIAYDRLFTGVISATHYSAADVVLVSSIAPTLFEDPDSADPNDVVYHQLDGSADGDVTGGVSSGIVQYFRIFQRGTNDLLVTYVQGATHNDFNCCGINDGSWVTGPGVKIGREAAQAIAKSYYLAMLEYYLRGNEVLGEYLQRHPEGFRPIAANAFLSNQFKLAADGGKFVIDDFQSGDDASSSSSGGTVTFDVANHHEGYMDDNGTVFTWSAGDPMNGMTQAHSDGPTAARGAVFDWSEGDDMFMEWDIIESERNFSDERWLSFRACQGTRHPNTVALDDLVSFTVTLTDGAGVSSSIDFGVYGRITEPYDRTGDGNGVGWANEFNTVRIRLTDFETDGSGLDLTNIASVRFEFGEAHGSPQGRIGIDDLEVLKP